MTNKTLGVAPLVDCDAAADEVEPAALTSSDKQRLRTSENQDAIRMSIKRLIKSDFRGGEFIDRTCNQGGGETVSFCGLSDAPEYGLLPSAGQFGGSHPGEKHPRINSFWQCDSPASPSDLGKSTKPPIGTISHETKEKGDNKAPKLFNSYRDAFERMIDGKRVVTSLHCAVIPSRQATRGRFPSPTTNLSSDNQAGNTLYNNARLRNHTSCVTQWIGQWTKEATKVI